MKIKKILITTSASLGIIGGVTVPMINKIKINYMHKNQSVSKKLNDQAIIITSKKINDFVNSIKKTISYKGENGHGYILDNKSINTGIIGLTFEYGISKNSMIKPSNYSINYKLLRNLNNKNYFFIKILKVDPKYVLENSSKIVFLVGEINLLSKPVVASYYLSGGVSVDRTYHVVLSAQDTIDLWKTIQYFDGSNKNDAENGGIHMFDFLTTKSPNPTYWEHAWEIYEAMYEGDDYFSFMDAFALRSTHTWCNYNYFKLYQVLKLKGYYGIPIKINFKVDFKFLAHNLYGVTYS